MSAVRDPARVQVHDYTGAHMFCSRPASGAAFKKDVQEMIAKH